MREKLVKLALISSFIIPQTHAWAKKEAPAASSAPSARVSSPAVFRNMMNDPELNALHLRAQERRLKTAIDLDMQYYFDINPIVQKILPSFLRQLDQSVVSETTKNELTMDEITKSSNKRLYYKLVKMLRTQGYSDRQIKKTVFYRAMGEVNAYAYTYSPDKVGFVLLTGLDEIASIAELMGVFGHESGHIRSGHVKLGALDSMMQIRLMNHLINKGTATSDDESITFNNLKKKILNKRAALYLEPKFISTNPNDIHAKSVDINAAARVKLSRLMEMADVPRGFFSADEEAQILTEYVDKIIQNLSSLEVPSRYVVMFQHYKDLLQAGNPLAVNVEQMTEALEVWTLAYSREMETTADYFGTIIGRPSRVAMMDGKFSGREIPVKPSREDIRKIIKAVTKQVQKSQRMNTRDDYYEMIGGPESSDHPLSNLRILRQARFDQSLERISLENPFLRILVDLDDARMELGDADDQIKQIEGLVAQAKANKMKRLASQYQSLLKKQIELKAQAARSIAKIEPQLKSLLEDEGLKAKNPRLTNLIDYRLAQKQIVEASLALLPNEVGNDPNTKETIKVLQSAVLEVGRDPMLQTALSILTERTKVASPEKAALELTRRALSENAKPEDTLKARHAILTLTGSNSRIAIDDIKLEAKSASTVPEATVPFKGEDKISKAFATTNKGLACRSLF